MNSSRDSENNVISNVSIPKLVLYAVIGIVAIFLLFNIVKNLDASQLMCIQNPITGHLNWYTAPGPKVQLFGKVTKYDKRSIYKFSSKVRFNDGGHAVMGGSVQFDMPIDKEHLNLIQTKYGCEEAIKTQLLQTVVNKSIYMTGPMMSSKESYAEKRNYLINYVEDQISNGIYKTLSRDTIIKDPLSGTDKTVTYIEISMKNGIPERQDEAVLKKFGITAFNFAIDNLDYDPVVEKQIQQQQQITMDVQTSIADAKKAEQRAITVEANGKADAAKAKWDQEVIKARAITSAEKDRDSANLAMQASGYIKQAAILQGEGEAAKRKLIMSADGALEKKLATYEAVNQMWAQAFEKFQGQLTPTTVMGGSGNSGSMNAGLNFMEIMTAKAAHDLSLDMGLPGKK
jgi:regulator of protease activity HflC (stomatin/prohibitin superfamily)